MKLRFAVIVPAIMFAGFLAMAPSAHAVDGVTLISQATSIIGLPGCVNVGTALVTICKPGSYRLSGDLIASGTDGIDIHADGVTLDLNGFTISQASAGSHYGVASENRGVTVENGVVQGFARDISLDGAGETVTGVHTLDGSSVGIYVLDGQIEGSYALGGGTGIQISEGVVENSIVQGGTGTAIDFNFGGLAKNDVMANSATCVTAFNGPVRIIDSTFDPACTVGFHLPDGGYYAGNVFNGVGQIGTGGENGGQNAEHNIGIGGGAGVVSWDLKTQTGSL